MKELTCDIFIAGAGAAGMAAALSACASGADVLLAEQDAQPGGILNRCIHHGFGLGYFGEDLTGREYAARFRARLGASMSAFAPKPRYCPFPKTAPPLISGERVDAGPFPCLYPCLRQHRTESLFRPRCGHAAAGVLTAGCLQGMLNCGSHAEIGDRIVILGSGNVGQIMARQLAQSGKTILAMIEQNDHPGGLARNHRECIEAYHIPLRLHSTVTEIHGTERISAVTVKDLRSGETDTIPCDTMITALGLLPDRSLVSHLRKDGSFPDWLRLCGNCDLIYDIVDSLTVRAEQTGAEAWESA